jgi:hypothetical protein
LLETQYEYKLSPCISCGERNYGSYTARDVTYPFFSKLWARIRFKPVPEPYIEFKGSPPPKPKQNRHVPQSRIDQLQLQQDLIELLPNEFDIYLEGDKVLVRRLIEKAQPDGSLARFRKLAGLPP